MRREEAITDTFVELANTLVVEFDVAEFLGGLVDRAAQLSWATAAGVLLAGPDGTLGVAASSSDEGRLFELFELQSDEGPCLECYRTGEAIVDAWVNDDRWPRLGAVAHSLGFETVSAVPLRYRGEVIGALNLYGTNWTKAPPEDLRLVQALADVATISILQHRASIEAGKLVAQLNHALQSRVLIEQAKGVLAESRDLTMTEAFNALREYSRSHNRRVSDVASEIADRSLSPDEVLGSRSPGDGSHAPEDRRDRR